MDERRKAAYRKLLYRAMLDIRPIAWMSFSDPLSWRRQLGQVRAAGEIADWLHNLASFSAWEFENFSEEWFWREFDQLNERRPEMRSMLSRYKHDFDAHLAGG
jgi:hypothetical protein